MVVVMAYHIETVWHNGYRCSCCEHTYVSARLEDTIDEAMEELPTEFPTEGSSGGRVRVTIKDGAAGKIVAESMVSFAPVWQRGDGYKFTGWSLYIDEEAVPGQGTFIHQIIEGTNRVPESYYGDPEPRAPLKFITDRSWSQLCDQLAEAKRQSEIRAAETVISEATKKLARLGGSHRPSNE